MLVGEKRVAGGGRAFLGLERKMKEQQDCSLMFRLVHHFYNIQLQLIAEFCPLIGSYSTCNRWCHMQSTNKSYIPHTVQHEPKGRMLFHLRNVSECYP